MNTELVLLHTSQNTTATGAEGKVCHERCSQIYRDLLAPALSNIHCRGSNGGENCVRMVLIGEGSG